MPGTTSSAQQGLMSSTATHWIPTGLWSPRSRGTTGAGLVFVMGELAEMPGDVSRICDITARDLARIHVSYYNDDAKRNTGMYRQRIQKLECLGAQGAPRLGPSPPRPRPGPHQPRPGAPRRQRRGNANGR